MTDNYIDLFVLLPKVKVDYEHYAKCEKEVLTPALEHLGIHVLGSWYTGDGDSFGPLSRCICTDRGIVVYA